MRGEEKIGSEHIDRRAFIYIRQSTAMQVRQNIMSQERQYGLVARARELGWSEATVEVIDEDQGRTGSDSNARTGFQKLRRQVAEGKVGIIFSLEASRLARNNGDWHHLLDLCGVSRTLVADQEGVYDVRDYNDRLLLGLKGTLSEAELHILKTRLTAGLQHKAQKGELAFPLPTGLTHDPEGRIVLDPDENVQHTMRAIFRKFEEVGTAGKVVRWMLQNGVQMPRRTGSGLFSQVIWHTATFPAVVQVLKNPLYAGAYVYGRRQSFQSIQGEKPVNRVRSVPMEKWRVLMPRAHQGYINWEQYQRNVAKLKENAGRISGARGAPGRGFVLCQGLIRCGRCGSRMNVRYKTRVLKSGQRERVGAYICQRSVSYGGPRCQYLVARVLDEVVAEAFQSAVQPEQVELSLKDLEKVFEQEQAADRHWQLRMEKMRYEAERAQRQFDHVEPEDRVVARELERRWNQKLEEMKKLEEEYARWREKEQGRLLSSEVLERIRLLARDVKGLWSAPTTQWEDRKELIRTLVEEVWVWVRREEREVEIRVVWYGNVQTVHKVKWDGKTRPHNRKVQELIRQCASEGLTDQEIAERLNKANLRNQIGNGFTREQASRIRRELGITRGSATPGYYNLGQAAKKIGVNITSLLKYLKQGLVQGRQRKCGSCWRIRLSEEEIERLRGGWKPAQELTVNQAAQRLKMTPANVYYHVKLGHLPARRAKIGLRARWLLPVQKLDETPLRRKLRKMTSRGDAEVHHEA
jgi:DNA invertase Pin-like site-specific DNA recombinase